MMAILFVGCHPRAQTTDAVKSDASSFTLDQALAAVLTNNPALGAARADWESTRAKAPRALEAVESFTAMRRRKLDLCSSLCAAYIHYSTARAKLSLLERYELISSNLLSELRANAPNPARVDADLALREAELARVIEERSDLARDLAVQQTRLNVLMNRRDTSDLPPPVPCRFNSLALSRYAKASPAHGDSQTPFVLDWNAFAEEMETFALAHNPELLRDGQRLEAAKARYAWGAPSGRNSREENAPSLQECHHEFAARREQTRGSIREQCKKIETNQNHYQLALERGVPLAQQALGAVRGAHRDGKANSSELLQAERALLDAEMMRETRLADYLVAVAELEALIGCPVPTRSDTNPGVVTIPSKLWAP